MKTVCALHILKQMNKKCNFLKLIPERYSPNDFSVPMVWLTTCKYK